MTGAIKRAGRIAALVAGGSGMGMGLGFAKLLFDLYKSDRAIGLQVIDSAPLVVVLLFGMSLAYLQFDRFLEGQHVTAESMQAMATANQRLASAVDNYTQRDEQRADAQQAAIAYVAQKQDGILLKLAEVHEWMKKSTVGQAAGRLDDRA